MDIWTSTPKTANVVVHCYGGDAERDSPCAGQRLLCRLPTVTFNVPMPCVMAKQFRLNGLLETGVPISPNR